MPPGRNIVQICQRRRRYCCHETGRVVFHRLCFYTVPTQTKLSPPANSRGHGTMLLLGKPSTSNARGEHRCCLKIHRPHNLPLEANPKIYKPFPHFCLVSTRLGMNGIWPTVQSLVLGNNPPGNLRKSSRSMH